MIHSVWGKVKVNPTKFSILSLTSFCSLNVITYTPFNFWEIVWNWSFQPGEFLSKHEVARKPVIFMRPINEPLKIRQIHRKMDDWKLFQLIPVKVLQNLDKNWIKIFIVWYEGVLKEVERQKIFTEFQAIRKMAEKQISEPLLINPAEIDLRNFTSRVMNFSSLNISKSAFVIISSSLTLEAKVFSCRLKALGSFLFAQWNSNFPHTFFSFLSVQWRLVWNGKFD